MKITAWTLAVTGVGLLVGWIALGRSPLGWALGVPGMAATVVAGWLLLIVELRRDGTVRE